MPTVVAVSGSLRDGSYTRTALRYALAGAAGAGADVELLDLRTGPTPSSSGRRCTTARVPGC